MNQSTTPARDLRIPRPDDENSSPIEDSFRALAAREKRLQRIVIPLALIGGILLFVAIINLAPGLKTLPAFGALLLAPALAVRNKRLDSYGFDQPGYQLVWAVDKVWSKLGIQSYEGVLAWQRRRKSLWGWTAFVSAILLCVAVMIVMSLGGRTFSKEHSLEYTVFGCAFVGMFVMFVLAVAAWILWRQESRRLDMLPLLAAVRSQGGTFDDAVRMVVATPESSPQG